MFLKYYYCKTIPTSIDILSLFLTYICLNSLFDFFSFLFLVTNNTYISY